jgi:nitrogen fixation/metabolism regulation signal transduction histidine kinase
MNLFKTFRFQVIARLGFILLTMGGLLFLLVKTRFYATVLILAFLAAVQIHSLIRYVERTNRELGRFLSAVRHADFSQSFTAGERGSSFYELNQALNDILLDIKRYRTEREEQYRYLQTVVKHVGIGLLVFLHDGTVDMINAAAKRMLKCTGLKKISALKTSCPDLVDTLMKLPPGERALIKVEVAGDLLHLAIHAAEFRMRDEQYKLVSLQNIRTELEETEMEAWQKMIRVLTHEIMNSITPISSLAATITDLMNGASKAAGNGEAARIDDESLTDIRGAVQTIQKRSLGLLNFVDAYRNLTLIPKPQFGVFSVQELFDRVGLLLRPTMSSEGIRFELRVDPHSLELTADTELIEQVLINLINNAIDAVRGCAEPAVILEAGMDERGRTRIQVIDNGRGIFSEAREKIFIPFFTTKKTGSGIGLSLSRQIMRMHGGSILMESEPQKRTVFTLTF